MSQEDCSTVPILVHGHLFLLEKAGPGLLLSSPLEPNSLVPISCSLSPGLPLPPNDLRSVVLRPLASGEASRDPLALTLGKPELCILRPHLCTRQSCFPWVLYWGIKNQKMGSPVFLHLSSSISLKLGLMVLVYSTFMISKRRRRKPNRLFSYRRGRHHYCYLVSVFAIILLLFGLQCQKTKQHNGDKTVWERDN